MEILEIDENTTSNDILRIIDNNIKEASLLRSEINSLSTYKTELIEQEEKTEETIIINKEINKDDDFEDEVDYYLEDYKYYNGKTNIKDLSKILPSKSNYRYKELLIRLHAESIKEIKDLEELTILEDDPITLIDIRKEIIYENDKIKCIKELLIDKELIKEQEKVKNNLILAPSLSGKIVILDDLKHIPSEYYPAFCEIITSVENGTFKGVKRLSNDSIYGVSVSEVRGDGIRVLFQRLNNNTYSLITAFTKKTDSNRGYKDFVRNRLSNYSAVYDYIKESLDEISFRQENKLYVEEMFRLLGREEEKTYKIGDKHE